jgi:hypothetical protein
VVPVLPSRITRLRLQYHPLARGWLFSNDGAGGRSSPAHRGLDEANQLWPLGTGTRYSPRRQASERFFALQDNSPPQSVTLRPLQNRHGDITGTTYSNKPGWYIRLTGTGEDALRPQVFAGWLYFPPTPLPPEQTHAPRWDGQ